MPLQGRRTKLPRCSLLPGQQGRRLRWYGCRRLAKTVVTDDRGLTVMQAADRAAHAGSPLVYTSLQSV
jgi:hypothetical protein